MHISLPLANTWACSTCTFIKPRTNLQSQTLHIGHTYRWWRSWVVWYRRPYRRDLNRVCQSCRYEVMVIGLTWASIICGVSKHNHRCDSRGSYLKECWIEALGNIDVFFFCVKKIFNRVDGGHCALVTAEISIKLPFANDIFHSMLKLWGKEII